MIFPERKNNEDVFTKDFLSQCEIAHNFGHTTHIRFLKTIGSVTPELYEYAANETLTLNGDFICPLFVNRELFMAIKKGHVILYKHQPTYSN